VQAARPNPQAVGVSDIVKDKPVVNIADVRRSATW
jgi:hypothetical protein